MGKLLIVVGLVVSLVGLALIYAPGGLLSWFGRLPGDIYVNNENSKIFIPVTSMILISIVLTIVLSLFSGK